MLLTRLHRTITGLILACFSSAAFAGLISTTVSQCTNSAHFGAVTVDISQCSILNLQANPLSATVGDSVEFNSGGNRLFDFDDNTLTIQYNAGVTSFSPDLIIFTMADPVSAVTLLSANPLNVTWTFSGNRIGMLINSPLVLGSVTFGVFNVAQVPEPGSIALAGLALLALARVRRNRKVAG